MAVDPTDPETFTEDDQGQATAADELDELNDLDEEVPQADAAEQHKELQQEKDERPTGIETGDANEADATEQARVVTLDEDDYR
ncbi:hypothetical protein [Streptomyces formicae]|uniref:Uncharacterized protein n=1 Tax=Streptomyces formicae TaxID=1616117 RepID=A0ABY3WF27_9ACTN|nr:hypothetical protein [Streptomyces formicae]UNM11162.1 hypothetical protein J4032_06195 [Streptomyces formicae]